MRIKGWLYSELVVREVGVNVFYEGFLWEYSFINVAGNVRRCSCRERKRSRVRYVFSCECVGEVSVGA